MTIQIQSPPIEAKVAKAIKSLEQTQMQVPTKLEFVTDAIDHYYDYLIKKKFIR